MLGTGGGMRAIRQLPTRRFTVEEVQRMVEVGVLGEDEPVELLDGRLVLVSPQGPPHRYALETLADRLREIAGDRAIVMEEKPLVAGEHALPEPDVALVRGRRSDYRERHPRTDECELVVEAAHRSQAKDRSKAETYAAHGVPVFWLLDIVARRLEVHSGPSDDGRYASVRLLGELDEVLVPGRALRWRVADLLP